LCFYIIFNQKVKNILIKLQSIVQNTPIAGLKKKKGILPLTFQKIQRLKHQNKFILLISGTPGPLIFIKQRTQALILAKGYFIQIFCVLSRIILLLE
jgi:hypothetical protein